MKKKQSYQNGSIRKRGNKYYYRFRMEEPDGTMKLHEYPDDFNELIPIVASWKGIPDDAVYCRQRGRNCYL